MTAARGREHGFGLVELMISMLIGLIIIAALVTLFVSVGLWLFGRALAGERRALAGWALVSGLALATHYFAAFVVLPEAVWLLARASERRRVEASRWPAGAGDERSRRHSLTQRSRDCPCLR